MVFKIWWLLKRNFRQLSLSVSATAVEKFSLGLRFSNQPALVANAKCVDNNQQSTKFVMV
jgi:hypothetical protein